MLFAAASGLAAVVLGALGAHAFGLDGRGRAVFDTALLYHLVHSPAVALAAFAPAAGAHARYAMLAGITWSAGVVLFSGTLYLVALAGLPGWPAPVGGSLLMLGWILLGVAGWRGGGDAPTAR